MIPPYAPSVPEWMRQVAQAANPVLGAFDMSRDFSVYAQTETTRRATLRMVGTDPGAHAGLQYSQFGIEHRPTGSGANGPDNADIGFTVSAIKRGWPLGGTTGEMDIYSGVLRQTGTTSDGLILMGDAAGCNHTGFLGFFEGTTQRLHDTTFATVQSVRLQGAVLDNVAGNSMGYYALAETGTISNGLLLRSSDASNKFADYITCVLGGATLFNVAGDGTVTAGAFTANADAPVTGYVTIKTTDGTTRKLAVIA